MYIFERLVAGFTFVINIITLSPLDSATGSQSIFTIPEKDVHDLTVGKGPRFEPPGGYLDGDFVCKYPKMVGWESCSTPTDRKCWLRRISDGKQYDIFTNYENEVPLGVTRYYDIDLEDSWYDADGMNFTFAKLFNNKYPGPWIQACWGDEYVLSPNLIS